MNKDKIFALKHIANENIFKILDALNIDYSERYKYVYSTCPVHKGDRPNAWSWHLDYGVWRCFTKSCEGNLGKDIYGLVRGVLDCKFPEAISFVEKICGGENVDVSEVLQIKDNKNFVNRARKTVEKIYPESCLNRLIYHTYLEGRGYPKELVEKYNIGITGSKYKRMSNRIIIPVRNLKGELVGFTGRTLYEDWKERKIGKWEHSDGFAPREALFNIDKAAPFIRESGRVILCEGPLDVLRLEQAGIHNSVAIFGRVLHPGQVTLLIKVGGVDKIIVALDGDIAGKTGAEDAVKLARNFFDVQTVDLGDGDVGDLSVERTQEIFI